MKINTGWQVDASGSGCVISCDSRSLGVAVVAGEPFSAQRSSLS
jgi:hypothetical protein